MKKLDGYSLMIVSKYFTSIKDFINVILVCKKYKDTLDKFHFNPIPLNVRTRYFFPKIETLVIYTTKDYCFNEEKFFKKVVLYPVNYEDTQNSDDNVEYKKVNYSKKDRNLFGNVVPLTIKSIANNCFYHNEFLKSVNIPNGVTSIGEMCFDNCLSLQSVSLPSTLLSIGNYCFLNCCKLSEIKLPMLLKQLNDSCFVHCVSLTQIEIPKNVLSIGKFCFLGCKSLEKVIIHKGLVLINQKCFSGCISLKTITIPSTVTTIEECTFFGCSSLETIDLPAVKKIEDESFFRCSKLSKINFSKKLPKFGNSCFFDSLLNQKTLKIPSNAFLKPAWLSFIEENNFVHYW
ncbi:hypothetical protein EIN_369730 [Entamoeba invadens IP1]|uniref:Leucine rich repeat containing protein BspA family protein n=1 Tax=Entamoeba invadens IP1 TaxID=370355 RepID=A0A0A1UBP9_ENTIV|nr:hypothetical protein EIN_369730 [Entamoeba invadens IP1]ELP92651.1 hypothetical protein EIN_369730 [Entamoeba invadens IP1]|eukprot:XP_004259422.1 hypothetical protein EIN_369730 [Entamoeba invadens IP1]